MKRFAKTYPLLTLWRVVLLYAVLMLCRLIFALYNASLFGEIGWSELPLLFVGGLRFDTISIVYAFGVWIVASLVPLHLRERKWYCNALFWYYVVVGAIVVAVNLADAVYFRYTQKRFTAEEIFFADNSNSPLLVLQFALENWHLVVAGVALIALLVVGYRRKAEPVALMRGVYYYVVSLVLLCGAVAMSIAGIRGGFSRMARPTAIPYAMKFATDGDKANIVLSNPFCILRTAGNRQVDVPRYFEADQLSAVYTPYHFPSQCADSVRRFRPRNVVVVVMESMSAEHSAHLCGEIYANEPVREGYTPFLDSLMREGLTFRRMYANGKRSIQALPSVWSSIPSLVESFVLMPEALGRTKPLPKLLADEGYSTAFFCGSERGSMGFDAYAVSAGFERCLSMEDYKARYSDDAFDGYWGIWDHRFFDYMGYEVGQMKEPFLASIFTISSHHPFVVPAEWQGRLPEGKTPMQPCAAYFDDAVRGFFDANRDKEWFSRTIFVFVADHVSCERYAPQTNCSPGDFHVIGFIYTPDGSLRGEVTEPVSQIDLMPTLLGVMGYDKPYFAYGRDVFGERERLPIVVVYDNGAYKAFDEQYIYIFADGRINEVYEIGDVERSRNRVGDVPTEQVERHIKAYVQQYYEHAKRKEYIVPDSISSSNESR